MRKLRACACAAVLAAAGSQVGLASAAPPQGAASPTVAQGNAVESLQVQSARLLRLSKLQHAAEREVQLALVAETGSSRPETKRYAADLGAEFRRLTQRIARVAETMQIDEDRLRKVFAGENTAALRRESEDLDRLAKLRGDAFDRQFWIIVTHEQMAASDMLGTLAGDDPRIDPLVADMALLLDRATGNAVVAAKAVTSTTGRIVPATSSAPLPPAPAPTEQANPLPPATEPADTEQPAEGPPAADTPAKR